MATALEYADENRERFLQQLEELARIPSVSTDEAFAEDINRAANWLAGNLRKIGLQNVDISPTAGHPVVYAEWLDAGPSRPTVLLYAHYDVQPAAREDGWDTDPFEPTRKDGKIFARGIGDDKLHSVMIAKVAESFLCGDEGCPVNLKVVIEGEEEVGSRNFQPWVRENAGRLNADYCLVCDGGIETPDQPTVVYALRGLAALQFTIHGPKSDLHSGIHGGYVHNPAQVIAEMVAKLHNNDGSVAVPGFYDEVVILGKEERAELNKDAMTLDDFATLVGAPQPWGEEQYSLIERTTSRPTLEINGIYGGYTGDGLKTVIPARAAAKITCRLVNNQNPQRIYEQIEAYLNEIKPPTVELEIEMQGTAEPVIVPVDSLLVKALIEAYAHNWKAAPTFKRIGGTIPIAPIFQGELGIPSLLMGFNVADGGFHGPNEFIHIELFYKGVETLIYLLRDLGEGWKRSEER